MAWALSLLMALADKPSNLPCQKMEWSRYMEIEVEATNKGTNDAHAKAKMERGIAVKSVVKTLRIHVKLKDKVEVFSNIKMIVNQLRFVNVRVEAISVQELVSSVETNEHMYPIPLENAMPEALDRLELILYWGRHRHFCGLGAIQDTEV
ncbi:hypothetical protein V6N12_047538 [Hibiscus sabdariffa]|uniref:Uncharacterized protein n=1 Tax=Hibiscus sabdariffa TaxID=183260 RepID=A0ABR2DB57_9ROSI